MSKLKLTPFLTRRQALWLMVGLAGSMALPACTESQNSLGESTEFPSGERVSIPLGITHWIGFTPLYIALEKGFFTRRGLDVKFNVFAANTEVNTAFAAGKLLGLGSVAPEIVSLAGRGQDYRIVMVADNSKGGDGILARNSIADIADFKGKQIALEKGSVSHFFLNKVLEEAKLSEKDVSLINMTSDAASAAYQSGRIDIAVTFAPYLQKANDAQKDGRIIYDTSKMPSAIVDIYLFENKFVEEHPEAVQAFVDGLEEAKQFLQTNREEGLAIAGKQLQLSPEEVGKELQGVELTSLEANREMLGNPNSDIYLGKYLTDLSQFLVEEGKIDRPLEDASKPIDSQFVQSSKV